MNQTNDILPNVGAKEIDFRGSEGRLVDLWSRNLGFMRVCPKRDLDSKNSTWKEPHLSSLA
jgi:hypothetical protein